MMYSFREDNYIVAYVKAVGIQRVASDLNKSVASIERRVKKLRDSGAWDAILRIEQAQKDYLACLGHDEFTQEIATIAR